MENKQKQKKISIGVEDFKTLIDWNGYFVDKTLMIKELIECLGSKDTETVCIACHDLGAFACYYPNGRK